MSKNNSLTNDIYPQDILIFESTYMEDDEDLKFAVVSTSDGRHMDLLNMEDYHLQGFRCLYGDTLIEEISKIYKDYKLDRIENYEDLI